MSLYYDTYVAQLANIMVQQSTNSNFQTFLPGCIDYAEQRMYRELDLQVTRISDTSTTLSSGVRTVTLPTGSGVFVVVEQFNVWNSTSATSSNATRVPLTPVTKEFMDFAWPTAASYTGVPIYYAPLNNTTYYLGPAPDLGYPLEVIGTIRPTPLSSGNSSTFLTQYLPDVFMAASMIFASAYMQNFSAEGSTPGMSISWEKEYTTLMQSANAEELRKRFQSQGWQAMTPNPIATPPRT